MRLVYVLLFATLFVVLGYIIPQIYFKYFDRTLYYSVQQPASVDREVYKPCDKLVVTIVRTSLINVSAHATVQIYLVNVEGKIIKHNPLFDGSVLIEITNKAVVYLSYIVPCDLIDGKYYLKAIVDYTVPSTNIRKNYIWVTDSFTVSNSINEVD